MTQERKNEIGMRILKEQLKEKGMRLRPGLNREIGNIAKMIDVPYDEVLEFFSDLSKELFNEYLESLRKPQS